MDFIDKLPRQTKAEFESEAAELRSAIRREYDKAVVPFSSMTIRKAFDVLQKARGRADNRSLQQLSATYDIDFPRDFLRWMPVRGRALDLMDDVVTLIPEQVRYADGETGWIFRLTGRDAFSYLLARYARSLQEADVPFYLAEPQAVMKSFGYWFRSRNREFGQSRKQMD